MKLEILLFFYLLFSIYSTEEYQLSLDIIFHGAEKYDLYLVNQPNVNNRIFYSGSMINIEELVSLYDKEMKDEIFKGNYPLVYILGKHYIKYIKYFGTDTKFIISNDLIYDIEDSYKNYTIFLIDNYNRVFEYSALEIKGNKLYYVTIGKKLDKTLEIIIYIFLFFNTFASLIIYIIMRIKMKYLEIRNRLPIYIFIRSSSYALFFANILNNISFLFYGKLYFSVFSEQIGNISLFMYSVYKMRFYSLLYFILFGWSIISFYRVGRRKISKVFLIILLYDMLFNFLILFFDYSFHFTIKLNLFLIKNITEHLPLLIYTIYCFIKKALPLLYQFNYERRIKSNLVKCIKFKLVKLFSICIITLAYTIFFLNTPFLEKIYIYKYIDNFQIHYIFQLFSEILFLILSVIVFYPTKLPRHYFDRIVFNYKKTVLLFVNISEKEKDKTNKRFNISDLNFKMLKKISIKEKYPIVLLNPFLSSNKYSFSNDMHIGIIQHNESN